MANINLSQKSYTDYIGSLYLTACGVENIKFVPKYAPATKKMPVPAILVHVEGVQRKTGIIVNFDMWPRLEATEENVRALFDVTEDGKYVPKVELGDITFRVGYWVYTTADGEQAVREGQPKWLTATTKKGDEIILDGDPREFED